MPRPDLSIETHIWGEDTRYTVVRAEHCDALAARHIAHVAVIDAAAPYTIVRTRLSGAFMQVCLALVPWQDLTADAVTPERRLRALIAAIVARYEESQNFFLILSDFWTAAMRGPNAKRAALHATGAEFYVPVRRALVAAIRDGQRSGHFDADADAATLANVVIAAVEGVRLQHELDPRAARKDRVVAAVADLVLHALGTAPARPRGRNGRARRSRPGRVT